MRVSVVQGLRAGIGETGHRVAVVLYEGPWSSKLGDGIHDALPLTPLRDANLVLEDIIVEFQ